MASFLMIHGAWHGGWCFDRLCAPLRQLGHALVAPDLPGMNGDAAELARTTLDQWADFVVEAARRLEAPVILCGHSRGGIVISQAAERAPDLFAALVYISAALVPDGKSLYDILALRQTAETFSAGLTPVAGGAGISFASQAAIPAFYGLCSPEDQAAAAARLMVEPSRPLGMQLSLTDERYGKVPRHYIECTEDRTFPLEFQRRMQNALPCASRQALISDHSPFLCAPEALAAALNNIAERTAS